MSLPFDKNNYIPPNEILWTGRPTPQSLGNQYWYQVVQLINLLEEDLNRYKSSIGLIGYACDEGVRRNLGRPGAALGPDQIKSKLAKLSYHLEWPHICDYGNIICFDENLEACQEALSTVVALMITNNIFPIILGGGHDLAYGHFKGIWNSFNGYSKPKIGIVNLDAHFDMRPLENNANSGTPFFQIFTEYGPHIDYFILGIQRASNTRQLFEIAKHYDVTYRESQDCQNDHFTSIMVQLDRFAQQVDYLYITIDLDGFSSAFAPGVSAPSPFGMTPQFALNVIQFLMSTQKVISCDIAEMNPKFDQDHHTASLAARLAEWILRSKK